LSSTNRWPAASTIALLGPTACSHRSSITGLLCTRADRERKTVSSGQRQEEQKAKSGSGHDIDTGTV
jgi:hypothetical protein